jgi:mannose-6-phosphate isomerase-like protein (cupin superfamily)
MLSQMDGPMPGYMTLNMEVEIEAGAVVPRHTHPGIESSYVLEGGFELPIQGQPTRMLKPGDGLQIPPETPHAGGKPGDKKTRVAITYVVEKGKPLVSPAWSTQRQKRLEGRLWLSGDSIVHRSEEQLTEELNDLADCSRLQPPPLSAIPRWESAIRVRGHIR